MSSFPPNATSTSTPTAVPADTNTRRSSTRSIKRKKFDDELVESSLKSDRPKVKAEQRSSSSNIPCSVAQTKSNMTLSLAASKGDNLTAGSGSVQSTGSALSPGSDIMSVDSFAECDTASNSDMKEVKPVKSIRRKYHTPKIKTKTSLTSKFHLAGNKASSPWKPQDDLLLITAVQQTCDLDAVHLSVKFSRPFSLLEIRERWYNLLYNPSVSRAAMSSVKRLPMEMVDALMRKTPYSIAEEELIKAMPCNPEPDLETFEKLLDDNAKVFNPARTPTCLFHHWSVMKEYDLLIATDSKCTKTPSFLETLDKLNDSDVEEKEDELEKELDREVSRKQMEMAKLEEEVEKLKKVIIKEVVGITNVEFDESTYAVLKGRLVQFSMKTTEMTLGRGTDDNTVDADLSQEGPAHKISRKHFLIRLEPPAKPQPSTQGVIQDEEDRLQFFLHNQAKRPVFVDGLAVQRGEKSRLKEGSLIEVSCLRLTFHVNEELVGSLGAGPKVLEDKQKVLAD